MKTIIRYMLMVVVMAAVGCNAAMAQSDDEQVLVFRNTGEINLLYASEIDSIVCSRMDADSIMYDEVVTQRFYTTDTTLVVPIAEIDSVAFGSRNATVTKEGVRMMTSADSLWITRYDGDNVYYKADTPSDVLPHEGEKLFYGKMDKLFPVGLVAKVNTVSRVGNEYAVNVTDIELADVFDRLFFAGQIDMPDTRQKTAAGKQREPLEKNTELNIEADFGDNLNITGSDQFGIRGRVVVDALRGYFNMEADVSNVFEMNIKAMMETGDDIDKEFRISRIPLGVYALVFTPELVFDTFFNINAELSANMRYLRTANMHVSYIKNSWSAEPVTEVTDMKGEYNGTESQLDITCNGEVFTGVQNTFDFNILRETAGARLRLRLGPAFESDFGLGVLEKAATYDPEIYAKAELASCIKLQATGLLYIRDWQAWGEETEYELFSIEHKFANKSIDLFPAFAETRAVRADTNGRTMVTTATKSDNDILQTVESGFVIEDAQGEAIDSIFVGQVVSGTTEKQGLAGEIDITGKVSPEQINTLSIRPVFHYAGHTVAARQASLMSDILMQPMVFSGTNGVITYLSGVPFSGTAVKDGTLYMAGPHLPVPARDDVFGNTGPIGAGVFIDDMLSARLIGTWNGTEAGNNVTYTFKADGTGLMTDSSASETLFTYTLNDPQSGRIMLRSQNNTDVKMLTVINISETVLQYRITGSTEMFTLDRL